LGGFRGFLDGGGIGCTVLSEAGDEFGSLGPTALAVYLAGADCFLVAGVLVFVDTSGIKHIVAGFEAEFTGTTTNNTTRLAETFG
jgi:hypothetical protein